MKSFLFSAAVLAVGLLMNASTQAQAGHGQSGHASYGHASYGHSSHGYSHSSHYNHGYKHGYSYGSHYRTSYYRTYGSKFSHGYYYRGRSHYHWSHRCFSKRYNCYCYWDTGCRRWYYWSEPKCCYYPICYATVCTPTVVTTTTTTTVTNELTKIPVAPDTMPGPDADGVEE